MLENIISKKEKNCRNLVFDEEILPNTCAEKKHNSSNNAKMKLLMLKENFPTERHVADTLNWSISTANKIVNSDLNLKNTKKYNNYHLSQHHAYECKACYRTLYDKYLSGEKWKNVIIDQFIIIKEMKKKVT